jgi:hypothetical protein
VLPGHSAMYHLGTCPRPRPFFSGDQSGRRTKASIVSDRAAWLRNGATWLCVVAGPFRGPRLSTGAVAAVVVRCRSCSGVLSSGVVGVAECEDVRPFNKNPRRPVGFELRTLRAHRAFACRGAMAGCAMVATTPPRPSIIYCKHGP